MWDVRSAAVCFLALTLLCAAAVEAAELRRVPRITDITYLLDDKLTLTVEVKGETPTAGWTEPYLIPRTYVKPPADGVWEYDLFMKPPDGIAAQVLTEVKAKHAWKGCKEKLKGIRVYGAGGGVKEIKVN